MVFQVPLKSVLKELANNQGIVFLDSENTLKDALTLFTSQGFLSAPVLDQNKKILGLIDVLDMASFLSDIYHSNLDASHFKNKLLQFTFETTFVANVVNYSKKNPFIPVKHSSTLLEVLERFATGLHRVVITDDSGDNILHIVSQTDMFKFLFETKSVDLSKIVGKLNDKTIAELKLGQLRSQSKKLIFADESTIAIDAFKTMAENGISEMAIVDAKTTEHLISSLQASDIQGFLDEELNSLLLTAQEFKKLALKKKTVQASSVFDPHMVFCKSSTKFSDLIQRMGKAKARRIYVMKNEELLVDGIVSHTDIFRAVYNIWKNEK